MAGLINWGFYKNLLHDWHAVEFERVRQVIILLIVGPFVLLHVGIWVGFAWDIFTSMLIANTEMVDWIIFATVIGAVVLGIVIALVNYLGVGAWAIILSFAALFLLTAIAFRVGTSGWMVKAIITSVALTLSSFAWPYFLLYRRLLLGLEVSFILQWTSLGRLDANDRARIGSTVMQYLEFAGAIIATELAAGLLFFWIPFHRNPLFASLLTPLVMLFLSNYLWQGGMKWWPRVTNAVAVLSILTIIVFSVFPHTLGAVAVQATVNDAETGEAILRRGSIFPKMRSSNPLERSRTVTVVNPTDPHIIVKTIDDEKALEISVVLQAKKGGVQETPYMNLPKCLPKLQFWYNVFPRHPNVTIYVRDKKKNQHWEVNAGDYPAQDQPLPIVLRGNLQVMIETKGGVETVFQLRCVP